MGAVAKFAVGCLSLATDFLVSAALRRSLGLRSALPSTTAERPDHRHAPRVARREGVSFRPRSHAVRMWFPPPSECPGGTGEASDPRTMEEQSRPWAGYVHGILLDQLD